ncbi:hypothetical protein ACFL0V_03610 [Nanoarchaeota archaeon]
MARVRKRKPKEKYRRVVKKKRISKQFVWTLILAGLMIASVFGIMFSGYADGGEKKHYGDFEFAQYKNGWKVEINDQVYAFNYHPSDVEELAIDKQGVEALRSAKVVYLTFDPNTKSVDVFELMRFQLGSFFDEIQIFPISGVIEEHEDYVQPIITCQNATDMVPVIELVEANMTATKWNDNCLVLEINKLDAGAMFERVAYAVLGVIE